MRSRTISPIGSLLLALPLLLGAVPAANAQVSIGIAMPGVNIGIGVPVYPQLVRIPGYPVYYDPRLNANYFFYDGLYWVFWDDNWYSSTWYNGPWHAVAPEFVPLYVLRIPVRYYRQPPAYFRGWRPDAPPRWGEHWGNGWQQRRPGWDRWDRRSVPPPAPLPNYQRQYSGPRYPHAVEQQQAIRSGNYRYQPHDPVVRQQFQQPAPGQPQLQGPRGQGHERPQLRNAPPPPQAVPQHVPQAQRPPVQRPQAEPQRQAPPVQRGRPEPQGQGQEQGRHDRGGPPDRGRGEHRD